MKEPGLTENAVGVLRKNIQSPKQPPTTVWGVQDGSSKKRPTPHSLTCGVPDRESNESKYLREATELIEAWQRQREGAQSVSLPSREA